MIKFFRHIRQRMIKDPSEIALSARAGNRVSKYMLYAIGEIVLVVIGILIALQINIWNKEEQARQIEIKYLKEMVHNLQADSIDISFNIGFNEIRLNSTQIVLKCITEHEQYNDSMDVYFGSLLLTTRSVVNFSVYENIESRGIEIISSDSLRKSITRLYSFSYQNAIDFEIQDDHALQYHVVMPAVLNAVALDLPVDNQIGLHTGHPKDFASIKTDADFKNALIMNTDMRLYMLGVYKDLAHRVAQCSKQIRLELKALEE